MAMGARRNLQNTTESEDVVKIRFQVELEFVQCLSNPNYLNFLAQRGYFKDEKFVNYLQYLLYWKQPEYAKYLKYPQALYLLELLQYEHFRKELMNAQCAKFIDDQQLLHWQHYQRKRIKLLGEQADKAEAAKAALTTTTPQQTPAAATPAAAAATGPTQPPDAGAAVTATLPGAATQPGTAHPNKTTA